MRVLIVSFAFPPGNVIGAIRVGKLARYLDRRGHDVRVLTTDIVEDRSVPVEIQREQVLYTDYRDRNDWLRRMARWSQRRPATATHDIQPDPSAALEEPGTPLRRMIRRQYLGLIHLPDMRAAWIKSAIPAGRRLIEGWKPDLLFASAPPYTGLIVASRLARAFKLPWVADFRDLWVDNPYYSEPRWRRPLDAVLEHRTVKGAARLVTVSPVWAEQLCRRHGKPAEVVYNGYAEEDFPLRPARTEHGGALTIRYMGSIYRGFRDPSAVFAAIALLPNTVRSQVKVEFYSDAGDSVLAAAAACGVAEAVAIKPRVPYRRALELQTEADVLLLLQSNDQRDEGNLPAKLFEYLYARRPILFIGYERGIAARLVSERGAGLVASSPVQICDQLQRWLAAKQAGELTILNPSVCLGLSRDEQYGKLETIFSEILSGRPGEDRHPTSPPPAAEAYPSVISIGSWPS